jgi:hypothetical protein
MSPEVSVAIHSEKLIDFINKAPLTCTYLKFNFNPLTEYQDINEKSKYSGSE